MKDKGRKLKALHIRDVLLKHTDSEHAMNACEIIEKLEARGISAERKSVYSDIEALCAEGFLDVVSEGRRSGYKVASREFELAELKMLVDAVQSCRFISTSQCGELISKLSGMSSVYDAGKLSRGVYIYDRENDSDSKVFYKIDAIHEAISEDCVLKFNYTTVTPERKKLVKKNGKSYEVSPFSLIWQEENYYLIAYDHTLSAIRHYRVDRMENVEKLPQKRIGHRAFEEKNLAKYCSTVFEMFGGDEVIVRFRAEKQLAGAVFDRFGYGLTVKLDGDYFEFYAPVVPSVRFFGWVFGFDGALTLLSPENVVDSYIEQIERVRSNQKDN